MIDLTYLYKYIFFAAMLIPLACGNVADAGGFFVYVDQNVSGLTSTPLPACEPLALTAQAEHTGTCVGAWRYAFYECRVPVQGAACGVAGYSQKLISRAKRCRLPKFGQAGIYEQDAHSFDHYRIEKCLPIMMPEVAVDMVRHNGHVARRSLAEKKCADDAQNLAQKNLPPDYYGVCSEGNEFDYSTSNPAICEGNSEFQTPGYNMICSRCAVGSWRFKLTFYGPLYNEGEDPECGVDMVEVDDEAQPIYHSCRAAGNEVEAQNVCQSEETHYYDTTSRRRVDLLPEHRAWWDREQNGARCTTCDQISALDAERKMACLLEELRLAQQEGRVDSQHSPSAATHIVAQIKFLFELVGSELTDLQRHAARMLYEEQPDVDLCRSEPLENEEPETCSSPASAFCARLRQRHVAPAVRQRYAEICAPGGKTDG